MQYMTTVINVIAIVVPLASVLVILILSKRIASHTFKCKHCSGEFKIKWTRVLITAHSDNEYMLECPYCKVRDWCIEKGKDDK